MDKDITIEKIKELFEPIAKKYAVKKGALFGSRARGDNRADSDIDLLVEFSGPVSLLTLSGIKCDMEDSSGFDVDVVRAPLPEGALIEIDKEVELYAE